MVCKEKNERARVENDPLQDWSLGREEFRESLIVSLSL